jgi:arylsulfatase
MKRFVKLLALAGTLMMGSCDPPGVKMEKPNIIFILADDLSYRDLSCYGQEIYETPHLDRLASRGVRFTQAYVAAPECAPSRGCLMTGLHTGHGPVRANSSARGQEYLRDSDITIAEVLRDAGYVTGFTGKWGIGTPGSEGVPYKQGFDYSFGFYDQVRAHTYYPDFLWENDRRIEYPENAGFDMAKRYRINVPEPDPADLNTYDEKGDIVIAELPDPKGGTNSAAEIDKAALQFVKEHSEGPFFLYYAPQIPHGPVIIDNFSEMQDRSEIPQPNREWAAMVMRLDGFVGKLVRELKTLGVYDHTIIFFASDNGYAQCGYLGRGNGPHWPDDPWFRNKGPFTGGKFSVLEGGNRVPFFVSWESRFDQAVVDEPVWLNDFFPTAASLAGKELNHQVDGTDLWPALTGDLTKFVGHPHMYFSKNREQAVRMGSWKAYRKSPDHKTRLYLVDEDSYGERDLSGIFPEVVRKADSIMDHSYTPHEWYWTPDESREEYQKKVDRARETGQVFPVNKPNGMDKLPWEK